MKEKRSNKTKIALLLVILLQVLCFVMTFALKKQVYHEDEFFSYALANSSGRPFMYGSELQVADNFNSWETGDSFRYYIRTKEGTTFDYANVWANQSADLHPPLYYVLLHTISSFFPEKISWWWGFLLNIAFFIITQIYLFMFAKRFAKSDFVGLAVCIFYGFTIAALNTVMFIRMYEMATMFTVMLVYYGGKAADAEKLSFKKHLLPVSLTILGGALTQHMFLVYAFVFVALHCIIELLKKRIRNMFAFGTASLIGALLSIAVFPATIHHLFYKYDYDGMKTDSFQQYVIKSLFTFETAGYKIPFMHDNPITYLLVGVVILLAVMLPVLFLFRKELRLKERIPQIASELRSKLVSFLRNSNYTLIPTLTASGVIFAYVIIKIPFWVFYDYIDRYFFMIVPLIVAAVICIVFRILSIIKWRYVKIGVKVLFSLVLVGSLVYQNIYGNRAQYVRSECESSKGPINSYLIDADCILIVSSAIFLPDYSIMMENADDIFITLSYKDMYREQEDAYKKLFGENNNVFLAFQKGCLASDKAETHNADEIEYITSYDNKEKTSTTKSDTELSDGEKEMLQFFEDNYDCSAEFCTIEGTHTDPYNVMLYKLTKN